MARAESLSETQNENVRRSLRRLMDERMWSQHDAAELLGIAQQTISAFLSGQSGTGRTVAERIAGLLGEPVESVLGGMAARLPVSTPDSVAARRQMLPEEWDQKIGLINDSFCRAFKAGSSRLADLDIVRAILTPLLLMLPLQELGSLELEAMASIWLGIAASQREARRVTTVTSVILGLSKRAIEERPQG